MKNNNETISNGKFVAFTYRLTDANTGTFLFEAKADAPDTMVYGVTDEIIPGLRSTMEGLKATDKFSVTLPPEVAFGERLEDNVITLPASTFERDGKMAEEVKEGALLPMLTEDGYTVTGRVISIDSNNVTMDFNHPFAGLTVQFEGEVLEVRDATEEEKKPRHCCGGGCHHGDGGCGDGCGNNECGCHDEEHSGDCQCGNHCDCK